MDPVAEEATIALSSRQANALNTSVVSVQRRRARSSLTTTLYTCATLIRDTRSASHPVSRTPRTFYDCLSLALEELFSSSAGGTFIGCEPKLLGYFQGEEPGEDYILEQSE